MILVYGSAAAGFVNAITGITETNVAWANVLVKSSGWGRTEEIWFGIVSADASNAITVNLTSTSYYGAVADVCEYSGVKTSGYLDKTATDAGWGTSPPTGTTATTTQANELWIGGMAVADDPTTPTQTDPTNGFTLFDGVPYIDGISVGFLEKIVTSTGAASSGVSISYSCYHNGCIATFFAAAGDTTPPTYSNISANTAVAGALCGFNCLVNDDTNVSSYIFGTNNTGTWTNDTATTFVSFFNETAAWANVTKTLNDTVGNVVSYVWYANDTSDNWSSSDQYDLTLTPYIPSLQMTPDNVTCRIYLETFSVQINITNANDAEAFNFTIYYDPQILNYSSVSWGELGTGTMTETDTTNGILEGNVAGSPLNGNHWLLNITFQADKAIIWKNPADKLEGKIWFHQAQLNFTDNSTLQYIEGGINQIDVNQAAYTFLPIQGDVNNDGIVNVLDIRIIAFYYGKTSGDPDWPAASKYDLNNDNAIDILDLRVVAANFGFNYP